MSRIRDPHVRALRRAGGWKQQIVDLVREHGGYRAASSRSYTARNSAARPGVSFKTQRSRMQILFFFYATLRALGYKIENIRNTCEKHVSAFVRHLESKGRSAATLQSYFTVIKLATEQWMGKTGMLKKLEEYLVDPARAKRQYAATHDKSWTGNALDIQAKLEEVWAKDARGGAILGMIWAFGLRAEEALMVRLRQAITHEGYLELVFTKGGRVRRVCIDSDLKRWAIAAAMPFVGQRGHLGWPRKTLQQSHRRLNYLVREVAHINRKDLQVTLHGLRHQYACDMLERRGLTPPVRGGDFSQVPREERDSARLHVAEDLGHGRVDVTVAYYGSARRPPSHPPTGNAPGPDDTPPAVPPS